MASVARVEWRRLAGRIRERATAWAVGAADAIEIDRLNILEASRLAMKRDIWREMNAPPMPHTRQKIASDPMSNFSQPAREQIGRAHV